MKPSQTYKFCTAKETISEAKKKKKINKITYEIGENICKQCDWQGFNFQNMQIAHTTQQQKNEQPNPKMGRRPK